jgi:hypothetical protein
MNLNVEQLKAVMSGEVLRLNVEGTEIVILRADLYDRAGPISPVDDEEDVRNYDPLVNEVMREDDEHDPLLESYQKYRQ